MAGIGCELEPLQNHSLALIITGQYSRMERNVKLLDIDHLVQPDTQIEGMWCLSTGQA